MIGHKFTGFESSARKPLKTRNDKREHEIDADMNISEMRMKKEKGVKLKDQTATEENGASDDVMNYKSDREHGAYNSKISKI